MAVCVAALSGFPPTPAGAQEFVRQRLLVHNFDGGKGDLGRRVADAVSDAIDGRKGRELTVVDRWTMLQELQQAGFNADSVLMTSEILGQTRHHRADEYVTGQAISTTGRALRLDGALMMTRDSSVRQPIGVAEQRNVRAAADAFAAELIRARAQLVPVRRCENALRAGDARAAATAAREGIAAYPRASIARACLLRANTALGQPPESLLVVARAILAIDSTSSHAWEVTARAHDEIGDGVNAGVAWTTVARLQATDPEVVSRVVSALMRDGNPALAAPIITRATTDRPEDEHLAGLHWRVLLAMGDWVAATKVGEALRKLSPIYETQPDYFARMTSAYRNASLPYRAIATAAEGVSLHPGDAELYLLYTQLVTTEGDSALTRGLARFPANGRLLALDAQTRRRRGDMQGALESTRLAITSDSTLKRGYIQLAQAYLDVAQPDSALGVLRAGLRTAEDSAVVGQFALARGNALYRAANGTKKRGDFEVALRYLKLSKELAPSANAGFLVGSAAFGVAQLAATELPATKSCPLATLAQVNLVIAETELAIHGAVAPDAAKQFLEYAGQLHPYVDAQVKLLCS